MDPRSWPNIINYGLPIVHTCIKESQGVIFLSLKIVLSKPDQMMRKLHTYKYLTILRRKSGFFSGLM